MALNKAVLAASILALMQELMSYDNTDGKTPADAMAKFANDLADAIDVYVKAGQVTVTIAPADIGLQTSTVPPAPTAGPTAPKILTTPGVIS